MHVEKNHIMILEGIAPDAEHRWGICKKCRTPLVERKGAVNKAEYPYQLYCETCEHVCAEILLKEGLNVVASLLSSQPELRPGNVDGTPETLRRIMSRL